ncbi:MAG: type II 3-dehydroquinate dehydratase [Actinomycetota bacterium]
MKKIIIMNGPNLNLLGQREEKIYGNKSFEDLRKELEELSKNRAELSYFQSNHEGEIIDKIHQCIGNIDFIIINPGAFTHYSYGIHDAIVACRIPTIEVHISNIFNRENWRAKSVVSPAAKGVISGLGMEVYKIAILYILDYYKS